ncbi:MAG TPA: hypothetical protein VN429_05125 [Methanospirillum sp.]|uniref:hypothetical protein n=1 Tax=Methanospirillum sp. TaxID=45200 RepID=UPI002CA52A01|nr:hypothetical protein [Methanospirillum sp.]HWQ63776.1 hypothetical protein [Methanospirillum sp.]
MRGRTKEQVLEELNARRGPEEPESGQAPLDTAINKEPEKITVSGYYSFRTPIEKFKVYPGAEPKVKGIILKRLSGSQFEAGKINFSDLLILFYETAPAYFRRIIHGNEPEDKK